MNHDVFDQVEQALRSGGSGAGFDFLLQSFREQKNYPMLFEAWLMKRRYELGLPLIQGDSLDGLPEDTQRAYEQGTIKAAREVGSLYLADGQIPLAWPYFRAIGESKPVADAIERIETQEGIDAIIEIAFYEQANPRKGFELILANHGLCRAITSFSQYPNVEGREESAKLLIHTLQGNLVASLKHVISQREGQAPETQRLAELVKGRDWLFEGNSYYIDSTHVASIIQLSVDLVDRESLALALDVTKYGRCLSDMFQFPGQPPFQNLYEDHGIYLLALLGEDVEAAPAHFRNKITEAESPEVADVSAQVLVKLLVRLERFSEALEVSVKYLGDIPPNQLACPSIPQLCQLAGDFQQLRKTSREKGDLLSFAAATLQT